MKKLLFPLLLITVLFTFYYLRHPLGTKAIINDKTINIELAVTASEKASGLGGRDSLPQNQGMLFVYQQKDRHGFWMKGMKFPLDFVWIDGYTVVDLTEHVPAPDGGRPVELSPKVPVDKVLEVNAGVVDQLQIKIGDRVTFTD